MSMFKRLFFPTLLIVPFLFSTTILNNTLLFQLQSRKRSGVA